MTATVLPLERRRPRNPPLAAGMAAGLAAAVLAVWNPDRSHVPLCPSRAITGLDCPLCGGLRAVHDALHGHLGAAASHNLLVVAALPAAIAAWVWWLVTPTAVRHVLHTRRRLATTLATALVGGFWIARLLPFPALRWLSSA